MDEPFRLIWRLAVQYRLFGEDWQCFERRPDQALFELLQFGLTSHLDERGGGPVKERFGNARLFFFADFMFTRGKK